MEKNCDNNIYTFNLFVYDLNKNVYEYFTNRNFFGRDLQEAISNAVQWIEKSFAHFDNLEWVIERADAKNQTRFFINGISIDKYIIKQ